MAPSSVSCFLGGFASALAVVWISQNWKKQSSVETSSKSSSTKAQIANNSQPLMDQPNLEQRLIRKAEAVLQWRTARITVVVERCTNDFNYSAILRTVEALGVQNVWIIDPPVPPSVVEEEENGELTMEVTPETSTTATLNFTPHQLKARAQHHVFARGTAEWLTVREFQSTTECIQEMKKTGHEIWVTDLSQEALPLTKEVFSNGLPSKLAICFGTEAVGCSQELLQAADHRVYLPLRGFADSLNLGVATALVLHQLFMMDENLIGSMPEDTRAQLRRDWYSKLCKHRLLTPKQKKLRSRLQYQLEQCNKIAAKQSKGESLHTAELKKLELRDTHVEKLHELEEALDSSAVQEAIQKLLDNPPEPLGDVRRADTHRVCYVSKNIKQKNKEHWKNMAATANAATEPQEFSSFRQQVFGASK